MPDQIYGVTWNGAEKVSYTYDPLGRLTNRKIGSFSNAYTYEDVGEDKTTTLVKSVVTPAGTYSYTYDNIGNILSITDGTYTATYAYDSLNQLVRANDARAGKTYTYSYSNGNITEKKEYAYTTGELGEVLDTKSWSYGDTVWSDLLTDFNGTPITYDEIGNPLTMGSRELSWRGRQLTHISDGENEISYAYNGDGQRVSKTVNGTTTEYIYNGELLAGQKTGDDILVFMYDNNGDIFGFIDGGTEYYYVKNAQNDVTAIANADGTVIANYYYDSWGQITEITGNTEIAEINPIRYRSYYYDSETEWYFLNTRYYSPELCRFISSDGYIQTGQGLLDKNMFAYCENNPIIRFDTNGNSWSDVKNWFSNTFNKAKQWVEDLFSPGKSKDNVQQYNPHKKKGTTSPHNRNKHEEGQTRRNRDNGGEKGDKRRTPNPNKRRTANSSMVILKKVAVCAVAIVAVVGIVYIVANDATVVGIIDDAIIAPLGAIVWECASKVLA